LLDDRASSQLVYSAAARDLFGTTVFQHQVSETGRANSISLWTSMTPTAVSRHLSTKSQLVALLHEQLSGAVRLREIEAAFECHETRLDRLDFKAPKRSTRADAR
jgi:hypothetical protein